MRIKKILKRLSAFVIIFAILSGMKVNLITSKADYNPVNMYYYDNTLCWRGHLKFDVYVQIDADSAANKQVYIHYSAENGEWKDVAASYVTTLNGNKEIWVGKVSGLGISGEYAIKYIGDGNTYWDNNNGKNYDTYDILGVANVEAIRQHYCSPESYTICAAVKNIGYAKKVTVRYTEDNWTTYKDVDLSYNNISTGKNYEYWSVNLNLDESKMDNFYFCIKYEVNGQTYWNNNFDRNYNRSFYKPL